MENKKLKILAIDDNKDNLTSVKALIREAFPQALILTATEAGKGIELAQAEDPDAILLDVVMPGMDGFEACQQLKANPLTRYIPVVFLTAIKGDKEARIRALEVGAEAFLSKPIDEVELTAQIRAMQKIKAASEHERAEKENLTELVAASTRELDLAHTAALNLLEDLRKENAARKDSEEHLRLLFENLPSGVVVHAADTAVLFANPEALRLLGLTLEQMQGKTVTDPAWCFLREDGGSLALEDYPVNRVRSSGKTLAGQIIGIHMPGRAEPNWVQCSAYPQLDASGQISQVIVAFADITERKLAEAKIELESLLSNTIIDSIPGTFYLLDGQGRYARWNTYQREVIIGKPEDQIAGMNAIETIHPEDRDLIQERIANVLQHGKEETVVARVLLHGGPAFIWMMMTGRRMMIEGRPFLVGTGIDVTERKQAEEALRKSQAILQAAMDHSTAGIAIVDAPGGELRYVNDAGLLIRGETREAVVNGIGINEYVASWHILDLDGRPLEMDEVPLTRAVRFGETCSREFIIRRTEDDDRVVSANAAPIRDEAGKVVAGIVVFLDITESRRAAMEKDVLQVRLAQAQKMESVGRLAGGVAHDFNNLLMGIMSYAELCRDYIEPDHPIHEWLNEITADAERSAKLTHQLLAFARKQIITPKVLDLNDAISCMLKLLRRLIGEDVTMKFTEDPDTWPVKIDPVQIDQLLANLCVNARDAIGGVGSVTVETGNTVLDEAYCTANPESVPGDYATLTVTDTGCGMDKETIAHIFEPFFTTKDLGQGTGLGLATVFGIVKQNNGFINVYSEPGKGATFKIYLPRHVCEETDLAAAAAPAKPPRGNETVLFVEDEKSIRITMRHFLEDLGYTMLVAEAPEQALTLAAAHSGEIHLLITDVVMPGMSGRDLATRLSELRPSIKRLFISGFTADVIAQRGILDDGVNFLSKPFGRDALARKVREVLEGGGRGHNDEN